MSEFECKTIAEWQAEGVIRVEDGNHGENRPRKHEFCEQGMAFIRAADMRDGSVIFDGAEKINEVAEARVRKGIGKPNDILISHKGTVGRVARAPNDAPPFVCSPQTTFWRVLNEDRIDRDYLFALMRSYKFQSEFSVRAGETDMAGYVSLTSQRDLELELPLIDTQRAIGRIIGALDDKIDLNRRMSATLEEMARALYRSWFVDFDPVHARAAGQPPAHMDTPTAALFPDSFGPDGLPEGWEMSTIGEVADTVGGATPKTKEPDYWDGPHRWATPRDLSKLAGPILFETDRTLTDAGLAKISSGLSPAGTVLLSSRAPIGYVAITQNPVAVNQGFIALRETDKISSVEAYFWVQANMDAILANANGSTFQEISKKNFRPLPCVVATRPVRTAFRELAGKWFDRVAGLSAKSANLADLRDALLPRLMSGELRVREAEAHVEEAV